MDVARLAMKVVDGCEKEDVMEEKPDARKPIARLGAVALAARERVLCTLAPSATRESLCK